MIQEHFCNYENSLALKELGFIGNTICGWDDFKLLNTKLSSSTGRHAEIYWHKRDNHIRVPLLSQAIQWIQEQFNFFIDITHSRDLLENPNGWRYEIRLEGQYMTGHDAYETWNQCAQDGLSKAIQIIKDEKLHSI